MPKDFFKVETCTALSEIPAGGKIHLIGVCGVAMAPLAVSLAEKGYVVSGSDEGLYDPMKSLLESSSINTIEGFSGKNIPTDIDLVVIGNAISYGHEEVAVVEENNHPYTFFSKLLFESVIEGHHSIVVSGTHGKSTSTALLAHALKNAGLDPAYFVGGIVDSLERSLYAGGGAVSVVEGDEYDSAFFAKVPKFVFYKPDTLIVTSVEFDHADIYNSIEDINREFTTLVASMSEEGTVLVCIDAENARQLYSEWKDLPPKIISYGTSEDADIRLSDRIQDGFKQKVGISGLADKDITLNLSISGEYNAKNALAVLAAANFAGVDPELLVPQFDSFSGIRRRQQVRFEGQGVSLIEDFAHHPTAVEETLKGVREAFPERRIIAAFEPRSAASKRKIFQDRYSAAFDAADLIYFSKVLQVRAKDDFEYLNADEVVEALESRGKIAKALPDAVSIQSEIITEVQEGDVIVIMTNGSFDGLVDKLVDSLIARFG